MNIESITMMITPHGPGIFQGMIASIILMLVGYVYKASKYIIKKFLKSKAPWKVEFSRQKYVEDAISRIMILLIVTLLSFGGSYLFLLTLLALITSIDVKFLNLINNNIERVQLILAFTSILLHIILISFITKLVSKKTIKTHINKSRYINILSNTYIIFNIYIILSLIGKDLGFSEEILVSIDKINIIWYCSMCVMCIELIGITYRYCKPKLDVTDVLLVNNQYKSYINNKVTKKEYILNGDNIQIIDRVHSEIYEIPYCQISEIKYKYSYIDDDGKWILQLFIECIFNKVCAILKKILKLRYNK